MSEIKIDPTVTGEATSLPGESESPIRPEDEFFIDPEVEKRLTRKFDLFMLPQFIVLPFMLFLDRSNIGNARVFGFEEDLNLVGNQFGNINTIFYASYVVFEIPWVVAIKRYGAKTVIPITFVGWSVATLGTGFVRTYARAIVCRVLLGIFESGLFPGLAFFISTIYTRETQGKRMASLYIAGALSGAFGGLIAYGIQLMGDQRGLEAWRWLFIIEGSISLVICGISWLTLPQNAETAWFLNEQEKTLMQRKKQRDMAYKGDDTFSWKYVTMAFKDIHIYLVAICSFCSSIPLFGFATFLPTILLGLGYTPMQANYLTIPVYIWGCILLFASSWISDRYKQRGIVCSVGAVLVLIGYAIAIGSTTPGASFFAMFVCCGGIYVYNTGLYTWISNNLKPDYKRSVGIPMFASLSNVSGTISSQIYPKSTGPRYVMGNSVSMAMEFLALSGILAIYLLLRSRNLKKQKLIREGVTDNGQEGDRALDFEYIL